MGPIDIIIIVLAVAAVVGVVAYNIWKKKQGKGGCGCGCSGCPSAGSCASVNKTQEDKAGQTDAEKENEDKKNA